MKNENLNLSDGTVTNPIAVNGTRQPIAAVLRILASGEGCDGEPYDQMVQAADYIEHLEQKVEYLSPFVSKHSDVM